MHQRATRSASTFETPAADRSAARRGAAHRPSDPISLRRARGAKATRAVLVLSLLGAVLPLPAGSGVATSPALAPPLGAASAASRQVEPAAARTLTYEIYIGAAEEAVWSALTDADWTERYGYRGRLEYELEPGGAFRARATEPMKAMGMPEVVIDGEVLEVEPPRRLVQTYRFLFNDQTAAEGHTRLTWEIEDTGAGFTRLALTHQLDGAPIMAGMVSSPFSQLGTGGWSWILSDLKSVLETGRALGDPR